MADRTFTLEIVTPDRMVFSDNQVVSLTVPGIHGYMGILAGHAPLMTELSIGEIDVVKADGKTVAMAVTSGFMEVTDSKVTVLADSAEKADEIDVDRARQSLERAQARLSAAEEAVDAARLEASLKRAINRIRVAERRGI